MNIRLINIKLSQFKGIKAFEGNFDSKTVDIIGENETGKTSIMDGWLWLMLDRDSRGYKGSEVAKTTNGSDYVHNLEHEVEARIAVIGAAPREIKLRKMLRENWVKPRGKQDAVYSGNVTMYWIDDVPYQANQYKEYINNLIPESLLNILSDPTHFCTQLHWKDRLSMLLDMAGKVNAAEVAGDDAELLNLLNRIGSKSMDEYKKMVTEQIKKLNKELEEIPVRISEVGKTVVTEDWAAIEAQIAEKQAQLESITAQETNAAEALKPLTALYAEHKALEAKRGALINGFVYAANAGQQEKKFDLALHESELKNAENAIANYKQQLSNIDKNISQLHANNELLRKDVRELDAEIQALSTTEFDETSINPNMLICPTCHQDLPAGDINAKIEQMKANFESNRDRQLSVAQSKRASVIAQGQSNNVRAKQLAEQIQAIDEHIEEEEARFKKEADTVRTIEKAIADYTPATAADFANHPDVRAINDEIKTIEAEIDTFTAPETSEITLEIKKSVQAELNRLRDRLYARGANEKAAQRMTELRAELSAKGAEKTILEGDIWAIERFVVKNTQLMESRINAMFTDVSFKLFKELINGGIEECCDPVVNGTTFGKANTAGQINAGLDIIEAISKHKDIFVPVFVDHAESVTSMNKIDTQMIRLIVAYNQPITVNNF